MRAWYWPLPLPLIWLPGAWMPPLMALTFCLPPPSSLHWQPLLRVLPPPPQCCPCHPPPPFFQAIAKQLAMVLSSSSQNLGRSAAVPAAPSSSRLGGPGEGGGGSGGGGSFGVPPGSPGGSFGVPGHSSGGSLGVMGGAAAASSLLAGYVDGGSLARTSSMRTSSRDQPAVDGSSLARSSLLYSADGGSGLARTSLRASSREQPAVYHGEMEEQFRQQQQQQAGSRAYVKADPQAVRRQISQPMSVQQASQAQDYSLRSRSVPSEQGESHCAVRAASCSLCVYTSVPVMWAQPAACMLIASHAYDHPAPPSFCAGWSFAEGEDEDEEGPQQQQQAGSTSSDVKMMEIIGRGGFGSVYKAFWRGKICAVKVRARVRRRLSGTAERGGRGGCLLGRDGPAGSCAVGGEETSSSSP